MLRELGHLAAHLHLVLGFGGNNVWFTRYFQRTVLAPFAEHVDLNGNLLV